MKKIGSVLVLAALVTTSCTPIGAAMGAGAAVGTAVSREGGAGAAWSDTKIAAYINDAWFRHSTEMFGKLDLTILEGRVLITGAVQKPEHRDAAVRFAWQAPGVRQVINEIRVEPGEGISGYARDSWIITQLRTRLITDKEIESINYKFDCDKGNLYVLGVARDQEELDRVINHARNISYVKEVISYIRLRSEPRPNEGVNAPVNNSANSMAPRTTTTTTSSTTTYRSGNAASQTDQLQPIDPIMEKSPAISSEELAPIR